MEKNNSCPSDIVVMSTGRPVVSAANLQLNSIVVRGNRVAKMKRCYEYRVAALCETEYDKRAVEHQRQSENCLLEATSPQGHAEEPASEQSSRCQTEAVVESFCKTAEVENKKEAQRLPFSREARLPGTVKLGHENWVDDASVSACAQCEKSFNLFRRRHHCRRCGDVFCSDCCSFCISVHREHYGDGVEKLKRVCQNCFSDQAAERQRPPEDNLLEVASSRTFAVAKADLRPVWLSLRFNELHNELKAWKCELEA
jgi:hypothetical protein